jgi:hypothetical protein
VSAGPVPDIEVSGPGGYDPRRVRCAAVSAGWAVSAAGLLTARLPARTAIRDEFGGAGSWRGRWVAYDAGSAGTWGGVIGREEWGDGEVTLTADGWGSLLRGRRLPRQITSAHAPAGAHVRRMLGMLDTDDATWLTLVAADEHGDPVAYEGHGDDAHDDVLIRLANASGEEWHVDADRNLRWLVRVGQDKTGAVLLAEGRHVLAGTRLPVDVYATVNDWLAVGGGRDDGPAAFARQAEDAASIAALGRRLQGTLTVRGAGSRATLDPILRRALARSAGAAMPLTLRLVDADRCFSWFREGDSVGVQLASAGVIVAYRVMTRTIEEDGTMECVGDVEAVLWP